MRSPSWSSRTFTCSVDWLVCFFLLQYICLYIFWLYDLVYWGPWAEHGDPLFFEHEHSEFYYVCTLESWEITMFRLGKTGGFPARLRLPRAYFYWTTGDWGLILGRKGSNSNDICVFLGCTFLSNDSLNCSYNPVEFFCLTFGFLHATSRILAQNNKVMGGFVKMRVNWNYLSGMENDGKQMKTVF